MRIPLLSLCLLFAYYSKAQTANILKTIAHHRIAEQKTIHVFVALCDNKYQGIVPVPAKIGNGQDPFNNLYWGCDLGIKTYFKKSASWQLIKTIPSPQAHILERCIFKNKSTNAWLVADAYDGQFIKQCTQAFLLACSGNSTEELKMDDGKKITIGGSADLLAYIGHDGLMDFRLTEKYTAQDTLKRETIILACVSKSYFAPFIKQTNATPLVWSTGLMAPEAYTLHDALNAWLAKQSTDIIRQKAAEAYAKYQKCSVKAAKNLLVTGW